MLRRHPDELRRQRRQRLIVVAHEQRRAGGRDVVAVRIRDDAGRDGAVGLVHPVVGQRHGEFGPAGAGRNGHRGRRRCRQVVRAGLLGHRHIDREIRRGRRIGADREGGRAALRRRSVGRDRERRHQPVRRPRSRRQRAERASAVRHPAVGLVCAEPGELDGVHQRVGVGVGVRQHHDLALGGELEVGVQARIVAAVVVRPDQQVAIGGKGGAGGEPPLLRLQLVVGQVHPGKIERGVRVVPELDPVVVVPLGIPDGVLVGRHEFVDDDGRGGGVQIVVAYRQAGAAGGLGDRVARAARDRGRQDAVGFVFGIVGNRHAERGRRGSGCDRHGSRWRWGEVVVTRALSDRHVDDGIRGRRRRRGDGEGGRAALGHRSVRDDCDLRHDRRRAAR